ncbi:secreted protein, partial [Candidatus Thiomargarita nelsonii]
MKSKILIVVLLYFINIPIFAFPSVDKTVGVHTLSNYAPYVLRDDKNENVFYLPFTRLAIARTESNKPDFSFVYLPAGLIIQLGVQVSIDQAGLQPLIEEIKAKNPNARFRYLPVETGRFMPTLRN